jgi:hypothetical protein
MEEIDILKKLKISNGVNGLSKEGDLLSEIIKVKWLSINSCVIVLHFSYWIFCPACVEVNLSLADSFTIYLLIFEETGNMLKQKSPASQKIT